MFITTRWFYRYGNEGDPMDTTVKEFEKYEKAKEYCNRYAGGLRFCRAVIEDEDGKELYEILADGKVNEHNVE